MTSLRPIADLTLGLAAGMPAGAATITVEQQAKIKPGATAQQVLDLLGEPSRIAPQRHANGPTWIYEFAPGSGQRQCEIDFSAAGTVAWIEVRVANGE